MATNKFLTDIDLSQNELQNAVVQNLASAPANPKAGQEYFNTTDNKKYIYNGSSWVSEVEQGTTYTEGSGIDITGNVISIDNTVAAATKCKITYDANGLVTGGEDLSTSDIPDLSGTYVATSLLGANSGVATLDAGGKVPTSQLPSYVDDVIEAYIVSGATPLSAGWLSLTDGGSALTPETGKIYVVLSSGTYQNKTYRWSGSTYVDISSGDIKKFTADNGALTQSSGVCTWSITNSIGSADVQTQIFEISSGTQVMAEVTANASTITIKMNSTSNIAANTYKAVIIG